LVSDTVEVVITYSPFGNLLAQTGSSGTVYRFTGEQYDRVAGLLYLRARFYNPALRVFLTRDPFLGSSWLPASQHPYTYGNSNPVNYTDPTGLCAEFGDDWCWNIYDLITHRCPQCRDSVDWLGRPLHELSFHRLSEILTQLKAGRGIDEILSHVWALPVDHTLVQIAEAANIPPELLGAVLQIVQETDYSTYGILDNDWLEDCVFVSLSFGSHPAYLHPPLNTMPKIMLQGSLLVASTIGKSPSPGLTQLQIRRAKQMEDWLFIDRSDIPRYEPMRQLIGRSENSGDLLVRLYSPQKAAAFAAVHIRWLMEQEHGPEVSASGLTIDDMRILVAQYNIGPRADNPVEDYSSNRFYRLAPGYIQAWQVRLQ
jgi:RHS repeat-associated protein